ncbi:phage tail spike protein [Lentibacillus salicampi]|uniref:Tail spike domain-containing protein n=1 Tax=Lentibacillus salicampi TaxID=175306 RepID=A0A4Y9ACN0_9BACI|nr:phage tail spike protein [Lentibacillus salicampi]TFJ92131.1 hypothetical protein E4U82_13705 [Lentibacillus salicampi]
MRNLMQAGGSFIGTMEQFEFNTPDRRASTELYIFSQDDVILAILSPETGLREAPYREELNQVADTPFSFTVDADTEQSQHIREENQVVFRDKKGDLQLYVIKELDQVDNVDGPQTTAICEPAFMEIAEHIVVDRRMVDDTADVAGNAAVDGTRWEFKLEVDLGRATTNFYYITSVDAIWKIIEVWGGEFKAVVEYDNKNNVNRRVIKILARRGADKGHRWEIGHNIQEIQRTVLSYPVTAMYGRGASLQTEGGGNTRYIDFADVKWSKANGDPVDKPKGQKWVGDPDALQKYGRQYKGKLLHREAIFSNQDYEDKIELLQATWDAVQKAKELEINYGLSVHLLEFLAGYEHEHVELGDTNQTVDRNFSRPIEIEARVIALEYDLLDIEGTAQAELGQFLTILDDDRLDRVIEEINDNRPNWDVPQIDESNYPDIKPETPQNVKAVGAFQTIQLSWDYDESLFVKHYEVFGSQLPDFVPDSSNLLWRGRVSGFAHQVKTDQVWYYYVRAVNYHGTASDYSVKIEASTVRIMSDDILFGEGIASELRGLSKTAGILAQDTVSFDKLNSAVKNLDGTRIKGDLISVDGTSYIADGVIGNAAIANAVIDKAHLRKAIIDDAHVDELTGKKFKAHSIDVDKLNATTLSVISADLGTVTAGVLQSSNDNTEFNLNTGNLHMSNADITFGSGAFIDFTSSGNKVTYEHVGDGVYRTAGIGVGTSINAKYPVIYMGTTGTYKEDFGAQDEKYFTGFISNTNRRTLEDDIGNSVVGRVFQIRDEAVGYSRGFHFDVAGSSMSMNPINGRSYDYDLGETANSFRHYYTKGNIYADQFLDIRYRHNTSKGWRIETEYDGSGRGITLVGLNGDEYNYNIGAEESRNWITHIWTRNLTSKYINSDYVNGTVVGTSTKDAKMNIEDLDGKQAFDYFDMMDIKTFYYKNSDYTNPYNKKVSPVIEQLDPVLANLYKATDDGLDINSNLFLLVRAFKYYVKTTNERLEVLEGK